MNNQTIRFDGSVLKSRICTMKAPQPYGAILALILLGACSADEISDGTTAPAARGSNPTSAAPYVGAKQDWDGTKVNEADAIVAVKFVGEANGILLNGVQATARIDNAKGFAQILIPSDESGISCSNSVIVQFANGAKGLAKINHCHVDDTFLVTAGQSADYTVGKVDVDNPEQDHLAEIEGEQDTIALSHEWSANGFAQLPARYRWFGGGATSEDAYVVLGVPETDDQVFSARCENGRVNAAFLLYDVEPQAGETVLVQAEVEGKTAHMLNATAVAYGEGLVNEVSLRSDASLLKEMAQGKWVYWQVGRDDGNGKLRVSLDGASIPLNNLIENCRG